MMHKYILVLSSRLEESAIFMADPVFALGNYEMHFTLAHFYEH